MQTPNDLSQSRIVLKQDSTLIAVIEMRAPLRDGPNSIELREDGFSAGKNGVPQKVEVGHAPQPGAKEEAIWREYDREC
jgi:hypothetical protein